MLGVVNRILLGIFGVLLLAAGVATLTGSRPLGGRHAPLLTAEARRRYWHADGWWWWALLAGLVVCVVLALWWLLAQLRRSRLAAVVVDTGDGAFASLRGRALEAAVAAEAGAVDGVASCRVALRGRRGSPTLRVALELEPHAVPADALAALAGPVLAHARTSTGLAALPTEARLRVTSHRAARVT
ncbi:MULTISPECIES: alkaline shock response membrane anchor protein AmaP [unclassified Streptomyces]|uniref:alkaline shock response membrane anchor protein AmaP n=1 Tax=unclassified Streptomyces TaxID=2593676 RepID=UPI0022592C80|nr:MULTISPECIES: alkaline shock response membrane anchor protein AmaP [unclassified Streptomyces]MCX4525167.1 alkaline shock response membrane anchor protein AmaP [Streptomyces sp. NBC_01551]MCX4544321.1 alkaline shock response membrane anchor protein AmaP [Streptomyces sp. NBC_01565]